MKTTSCTHSCGPGDFYPGGKCGRNGCVEPPITEAELQLYVESKGRRVTRTVIPLGWDPPPELVAEITKEPIARLWWSIPAGHPLAVVGDRVRVFQALKDRGIRWA